MRVTNMMIKNSSISNVNKAKNKLLTADLQYTSQKKIARPSDDPVIAVRALKYRTQFSEITQYVEKNIEDAFGWMNVTESAMDNITNALITMKQNFEQGANGPLTASDRGDIAGVLKANTRKVYMDEANADYAGRYVFTGYRTDTSLVFGEHEKNISYNITENFTSADIEKVNCVKGGANYAAGSTAQDYVDDSASLVSSYRIRLSYNNISTSKMEVEDGEATWPADGTEDYVTIRYTLSDGTTNDITATTKLSTDPDVNEVPEDEVYLVADTGELIFGSKVYEEMVANSSDWSVEYTKTEFDDDDIRPEMYFSCTSYNKISEKTLQYIDPHGQDIEYEINFSQDLTVNTQACDAVSMDIARMVDYVLSTIADVNAVEKKIDEVKQLLKDVESGSEEEGNLTKLKETLESEKTMREQVMQEAFGKGLTMVNEAQAQLSDAQADHGSRYSRLQMTSNKLAEQKDDFEQMLSDNEDIDLAEAAINLTQAQTLYNASLQGTIKVLGNSLLDYI